MDRPDEVAEGWHHEICPCVPVDSAPASVWLEPEPIVGTAETEDGEIRDEPPQLNACFDVDQRVARGQGCAGRDHPLQIGSVILRTPVTLRCQRSISEGERVAQVPIQRFPGTNEECIGHCGRRERVELPAAFAPPPRASTSCTTATRSARRSGAVRCQSGSQILRRLRSLTVIRSRRGLRYRPRCMASVGSSSECVKAPHWAANSAGHSRRPFAHLQPPRGPNDDEGRPIVIRRLGSHAAALRPKADRPSPESMLNSKSGEHCRSRYSRISSRPFGSRAFSGAVFQRLLAHAYSICSSAAFPGSVCGCSEGQGSAKGTNSASAPSHGLTLHVQVAQVRDTDLGDRPADDQARPPTPLKLAISDLARHH